MASQQGVGCIIGKMEVILKEISSMDFEMALGVGRGKLDILAINIREIIEMIKNGVQVSLLGQVAIFIKGTMRET